MQSQLEMQNSARQCLHKSELPEFPGWHTLKMIAHRMRKAPIRFVYQLNAVLHPLLEVDVQLAKNAALMAMDVLLVDELSWCALWIHIYWIFRFHENPNRLTQFEVVFKNEKFAD